MSLYKVLDVQSVFNRYEIMLRDTFTLKVMYLRGNEKCLLAFLEPKLEVPVARLEDLRYQRFSIPDDNYFTITEKVDVTSTPSLSHEEFERSAELFNYMDGY